MGLDGKAGGKVGDPSMDRRTAKTTMPLAANFHLHKQEKGK